MTEVVEVKPTEVSNPTEVKVDENEEKKIIETETASPTKHPMRPAKNSSNSYQSKPKFTFDQPEVKQKVHSKNLDLVALCLWNAVHVVRSNANNVTPDAYRPEILQAGKYSYDQAKD